MVVWMIRLCSGLPVFPENPAVWAIAVLFSFHYFKHSGMFQAQNQLQGRLPKAEGRHTAGLLATWWLSSQKLLPWLRLFSEISWAIRRSRKVKWQKEVQDESVHFLFLFETDKKRPEKWNFFSLSKGFHSLLIFNLWSIRKVKAHLHCFFFWNCMDICAIGCMEQTKLNL